MLRTALAVLALIVAVTTLQSIDSRAVAGNRGEAAYCHWFMKQAMNTGDEYWWYRYRSCMRGW